MRFAKVVSAVFLLSGSMLAMADDRGIYIGGGVTRSEIDEARFDDKDDSYKFYAGYRVNNYLAFEGALVDFGDMRDGKERFDGQSVQANMRLGFPIGQRIRLFGTAGVHAWHADDDVAGKSDDMDGLYGYGAEMDVLGGLGLRLEQETLEVGDVDLDQTSLSAYWRF
ncbi:porin family protein [Pseudomonas sp. ZM23]|uniref:Outer membrane beta-barrel protein n=1 Tax=Pseudomonas triclosanedens TaxID=2961893 RepID=A0ABY7A702_9PSED|nr:outer membrane beta-barrel protein [Pseudomonas triclosanedens]MCP8465504.1 porin family protein [Pseudomonas triclosanedens]MCP8470999.1 porin family protein [Pseudomonas triclosanedens]MCP8476803.1 porin family protein [Pseudomonas triclosanedens]WAI52080.1 outer membrane beta-barrel protein [Pseudomonas triclosanedens]